MSLRLDITIASKRFKKERGRRPKNIFPPLIAWQAQTANGEPQPDEEMRNNPYGNIVQGMGDMLHEQGEKRKAGKHSGVERG